MDIRGFAHPLARRLIILAVAAIVGGAVALAATGSGAGGTGSRPAANAAGSAGATPTTYLKVGATVSRRTAAPVDTQALESLDTVPKYSCADLAARTSARSTARRPRSCPRPRSTRGAAAP